MAQWQVQLKLNQDSRDIRVVCMDRRYGKRAAVRKDVALNDVPRVIEELQAEVTAALIPITP